MRTRFSVRPDRPGTHTASCKMDTGPFPGVKCDRDVPLTTHALHSLVWRVVELRRVCYELLSKGRKWVATWRTTALGLVPGRGDAKESLVTAWV